MIIRHVYPIDLYVEFTPDPRIFLSLSIYTVIRLPIRLDRSRVQLTLVGVISHLQFSLCGKFMDNVNWTAFDCGFNSLTKPL